MIGMSLLDYRTSVRNVVFVFALAFTLGTPVTAEALDLMESYRSALTHNSHFSAARAAHEAGKEKYPQGRAQLLPTIEVTGSKTYYDAEITYRGTTPFESGKREYNNGEYALTLTQPLYRKQNFAAYRQGKAFADLAEAQFLDARQELILRVTQTYFDVLAAREQLEFAQAQRDALVTQYEHVRHRLSVGTSTKTELHDAKARADIATSQHFAARNELEIKKRTLWMTVGISGIEPDQLAPLQKNIPLVPPEPNDIEFWTATAVTTNPAVRARKENVTVAREELERARGGHYPTLDLVVGYSEARTTGSLYTSGSSDGTWSAAGIQMQMPLYQGGYVSSRVREAVANQGKAVDELEEANSAIRLAAQSAFLGIQHGIDQVKAMQQALISSESALQTNTASYEAGIRKIVDVLNATQQVFEVRRDLSRVRYDYLLARLRLKAAAGTLSDEDIGSVNALLDRANSRH